jgi:Flp pilus assembly protein TadD
MNCARLLVLALPFVACDAQPDAAAPPPGEAKTARAPAERDSAAGQTPPTPNPDTKADAKRASNDETRKGFKPSTYAPITKAESATKKVELEQHLNAGRKAVRSGDYAAGIDALNSARAINPGHAKTLGELGWAYFKADRLDEAHTTLEQALHHAKTDRTRGAVLYNLGRVAEAKSENDLATELYARSIAVRPNDAVSSRLETLAGGGARPDAHSECEWTDRGAAPRHLCHAYLKTLEPAEEERNCEYETTRPLTEADVGGPVAVAAGESSDVTVWELDVDAQTKVTAFSYWDFEIYSEVVVLNVSIAGKWFTSDLAWVNHPGVGYCDENFTDLRLTTRQLVPGGRPEVLVSMSVQGNDLDPGIDLESSWWWSDISALSVDGAEPEWLASVMTDSRQESGPLEGKPDEVASATAEVTWNGDGTVTVASAEKDFVAVGSFELKKYPVRCPIETDRY